MSSLYQSHSMAKTIVLNWVLINVTLDDNLNLSLKDANTPQTHFNLNSRHSAFHTRQRMSLWAKLHFAQHLTVCHAKIAIPKTYILSTNPKNSSKLINKQQRLINNAHLLLFGAVVAEKFC